MVMRGEKFNMETMINTILSNLINAGWAMLIFLCAYISNIAFSLYHNIKQLGQAFDLTKILNSVYKIISLVLGLILLIIATTSLPAFANYVGWEIPSEYSEVFDDLAVLGVCLYISCRYIFEAAQKFSAILNENKNLDENKNSNVE